MLIEKNYDSWSPFQNRSESQPEEHGASLSLTPLFRCTLNSQKPCRSQVSCQFSCAHHVLPGIFRRPESQKNPWGSPGPLWDGVTWAMLHRCACGAEVMVGPEWNLSSCISLYIIKPEYWYCVNCFPPSYLQRERNSWGGWYLKQERLIVTCAADGLGLWVSRKCEKEICRVKPGLLRAKLVNPCCLPLA